MKSEPTRVLICDDCELICAGLKCALERGGNKTVVGIALNGKQAVDMAAKLKPDVVLMDVRMPIMDGIEATRRIKEQFPDIRVIVLTLSEEVEVARCALAAGADAYCIKSLPTEQLVWAIRSVCYGAVWLDPAISKGILETLPSSALSEDSLSNTIPSLTDREQLVLGLIVEGLSNNEIAEQLHITLDTVKSHVRNLFDKLKVRHRTEAAVLAIRYGLIFAA